MKHQWITKDIPVLAGLWVREDGSLYCRWSWHHPQRTFEVATVAHAESKVFKLEERLLERNQLMTTLPSMARHTAERLQRRP